MPAMYSEISERHRIVLRGYELGFQRGGPTRQRRGWLGIRDWAHRDEAEYSRDAASRSNPIHDGLEIVSMGASIVFEHPQIIFGHSWAAKAIAELVDLSLAESSHGALALG